MTFKNLKIDKEFLIKHKVVLACIVCTIFSLLTACWTGFRYFTYSGIFIFSLFASFQEAFCLSVYSYFFSGLTYIPTGPYYLWCLFLAARIFRYIYDVKVGRAKIYKWPLIMSLIFYFFSLIPIWNYANFFGIVITLLFLVPIYLIYVYRDELDVIKINDFLFAGLVSSMVLGFFFAAVCKIQRYMEIYYFAGRIEGFADNPNSISFIGMSIISGFFLAILKHRKTWWNGALCISITIFLTSLAKSKAFMLAFGIFVVVAFFILLFKNKKVAFISIGLFVVLGAIAYFCFRDYFNAMLSRFVYSGAISLNSVTTGRIDVWKEFLKIQFSDATNIILGMGAWTEILLPITNNTMMGCHSIYLEFFYYFGLIGIVNLILLMIAYSYSTRQEKGDVKLFVKSEDVLPLLMVFVMGVGEMVIFNKKNVALMLAILYIFNGAKYIPTSSPKYYRIRRLKNLKHEKKKRGF